MSKFGKLIKDFEELNQKELQNSAKIYGVAATLSTRLQEVLEQLQNPVKSLPEGQITQAELIARYGNYNNAYKAYQKAYQIKCKKGWEPFLQAIKGLKPPTTLEERVTKIEETLKVLNKYPRRTELKTL